MAQLPAGDRVGNQSERITLSHSSGKGRAGYAPSSDESYSSKDGELALTKAANLRQYLGPVRDQGDGDEAIRTLEDLFSALSRSCVIIEGLGQPGHECVPVFLGGKQACESGPPESKVGQSELQTGTAVSGNGKERPSGRPSEDIEIS